jgi:hypothetical protein
MVKDTGNTEDKEEAEETDLLAAKVIENEEIKLKSNDVNELSDKDDDDRYTSDACKQTLARVSQAHHPWYQQSCHIY